MDKRIGVIGIIIENRKDGAPSVNTILTDYGHIIAGRMGLPYKEKDVNVISIIVESTTDELGALTGKLGQISGVKVKSILV
ncbi:MAG: TM1266 family iron-only hydrogenase system putative regulator [Desulfovibrio sp.]